MINKEKLYFYIDLGLIALCIWQLISRILLDIQWEHSYLHYGISDWLINYQGGFVRRGLIGELIFQLYQFHPFPVKDTIIILDTIVFGLFFIITGAVFIKQRWSMLPLIFPLVCAGGNIVAYRRDFLIILLVYLIYLLFLKFFSTKRWTFGIALELLMVLAILIYEPTFFLFVPLFGVILWYNTQGSFQYRITKVLGVLAAPILAMGLVCLWKGEPNQAKIIWNSWQPLFDAYPEKGMSPDQIGDGVDFLGNGIISTFKFHLYLIFGYTHFFAKRTILSNILLFMSYPMIYFLVSRVPSINIKQRSLANNSHAINLSSIYILQIISMLPMLTVLSCDLGRTIPYCMYTTFFFIYCLDKYNLKLQFPAILQNVSQKVQFFIDNNRFLSSFPAYLVVFFTTPLRICFAPKIRNNMLYKTILFIKKIL